MYITYFLCANLLLKMYLIAGEAIISKDVIGQQGK
jgi:hypothetical protein